MSLINKYSNVYDGVKNLTPQQRLLKEQEAKKEKGKVDGKPGKSTSKRTDTAN